MLEKLPDGTGAIVYLEILFKRNIPISHSIITQRAFTIFCMMAKNPEWLMTKICIIVKIECRIFKNDTLNVFISKSENNGAKLFATSLRSIEFIVVVDIGRFNLDEIFASSENVGQATSWYWSNCWFWNIVQAKYSNFSLNHNPKSSHDSLHDVSESWFVQDNLKMVKYPSKFTS